MVSFTDDRVSRARWYLPAFGDFLFLIVALRAIQLGQTELLNDPGVRGTRSPGIILTNPRSKRYKPETPAREQRLSSSLARQAYVSVKSSNQEQTLARHNRG